MPSDFFSKTRLILLSPNVSTGLFSIEVRRCIDPIDQLSFFQVSQKVINKKLTFETDSTTSTSIDRDITLLKVGCNVREC
jgi:autotransporter adhesin